MFKQLLWACALSLIAGSASAATITPLYWSRDTTISLKKTYNYSIIMVDGIISDRLVSRLRTAYTNNKPAIISLNSQGGSPTSGMNIGSWVSELHIPVIIMHDNYCLSACAYIFLKSPRPMLDGILGFHQSRFGVVDTNLTITKIGENVMRLNADIVRYMAESGFGMQLVHTIFANTTKASVLVFTSLSQLNVYRYTDGVVLWPNIVVSGNNLRSPGHLLTFAQIEQLIH
jgi:hypothetical protein